MQRTTMTPQLALRAVFLYPSAASIAASPLSPVIISWVNRTVVTRVIFEDYPSHDRFVEKIAVQHG